MTSKLIFEKKFTEKVINASEDTIFVFNPQTGKAIIWNKAFSEISGYNDDEIKSLKAPDSYYSEEDLKKAEVASSEALESGKTTLEMTLITKDGRKIPYEYTGTTLQDSDGSILIVSIGRNITERKEIEKKLRESEEKYRSLFENMNTGFAYHEVIVDKNNKPIDYKYLEVNPIFRNLTGLKKENLIGKNVTEAIPGIENDPADWIGRFGNVGLTGIPLTVEEYSEAIKKWFKVSGYSPKKGFFAVTFTDITDIKITEQKLKESEKKSREAYNRANFYKDLFAHDINNILHIVRSSAELISYHLGDSEKSKVIEDIGNIINKQVKRGAKLVSNVHTLSKLEEEEIHAQPTEICKLMENAIDFVKKSHNGRIININSECAEDHVIINANDLLQDVFENILLNAVKYNENSNVEIMINVSKTQTDGNNYNKLEFIDNGIGVPDERKQIIFKRGNRELKGAKGMGLGLSLVKKILKTFNGKIWVEDKVKGDFTQGSNFIILLPELEQVQNE